MKFLPLLVANLRRKKIRTILTVGSFVVAFFLFGLLGAIRYGFRQGIDVAGADRLVVIGRTSIIQPLPLPYFERLKRMPNVKHVAHATWFGGIYQDPKNFFPQFAIVPDDWLRMYPEFVVNAAEWKAFLADRQGCIVGAKLAARFNWKVGHRVPLQAPGFFGGGSWDFIIRGIYHGTRQNDDETQFWLRHDYLYEKAPAYWKGIVGWYVVRVSNPDRAVALAKTIDAEFANSPSETRTQTESAFAAAWVKQMGNIEFLILAIGSIVFFTLLLVTGNTMAIAVRERTNELAVLKAIGYTDRFVLGFVLTESLLIAAVGATIGLWLARGMVQQDITQGLILLYLPPPAFVAGGAIALAAGVLAGLLPAIGAMRLSVVNALRRV
jgi:putative ABC transport system permease protein